MAEIQGKTLRDVQVGESATVRRLSGEGALKRHIMDMGITKGDGPRLRAVAAQKRGGVHPRRLACTPA